MPHLKLIAIRHQHKNSHKATLLGTRRKSSLDSEYVQITFKESSIVMAHSGREPMEFPVRYVDLDNSFGIEILNDKGEEQASLMAMFQGPNKIKCGSPGLPFLVYERVSD